MPACGFDCFGATGILTIDGQDLNTPAWDLPNLARLWIEFDVRGTDNLVLPLSAGRRGYPTRVDQSEYDLPFVITGDVDETGVATTNAWVGLQANIDALYTAVFAPVTTGSGTRSASLTVPSGAARTANVQVEPLKLSAEIIDPSYVECTLHLVVVSGRFA